MYTAQQINQIRKTSEQTFNERFMPLSELAGLLRDVNGKLPSNDKINRFLIDAGLTIYPLTSQSKVLLRKEVYRWIESRKISTSIESN